VRLGSRSRRAAHFSAQLRFDTGFTQYTSRQSRFKLWSPLSYSDEPEGPVRHYRSFFSLTGHAEAAIKSESAIRVAIRVETRLSDWIGFCTSDRQSGGASSVPCAIDKILANQPFPVINQRKNCPQPPTARKLLDHVSARLIVTT
jgi:hypothetical protein